MSTNVSGTKPTARRAASRATNKPAKAATTPESAPVRALAGLGVLSTDAPSRRRIKPATATAELMTRDPVIACLQRRFGPPVMHEPTEEPFANLVRSITHQQIANAAATAISGRLGALLGQVTPQRVLEVSPDELRNAGLSWNKVAAVRDLAEKADDGRIQLEPEALAHMSDAEIAAGLITVKGVGRWSAEMFLMFQLRRLDVWPTGDLSVRQGYATGWGIDIPTPKKLDAIGDAYRPYRSLVAWYCWQVAWETAAAARGKATPAT